MNKEFLEYLEEQLKKCYDLREEKENQPLCSQLYFYGKRVIHDIIDKYHEKHASKSLEDLGYRLTLEKSNRREFENKLYRTTLVLDNSFSTKWHWVVMNTNSKSTHNIIFDKELTQAILKKINELEG